MKNDKQNRRSIRLKGYDYSQAGAYFVTICTHQHVCLLGNIIDGEMVLNDLGRIVNANHFHGIVHITAPVGAIHESPLQTYESPVRKMIDWDLLKQELSDALMS